MEKQDRAIEGTEGDQIQPAIEEEAEQVVGEQTALRQELEETKAKEAEYLDGWQRARAELANARKRFQKEGEQAYTNARGDVMTQLLPIADDLERAFATLPQNLSSLTWIEGVQLIQRKVQHLLDQASVVPIETDSQEFDPFLHQAVTHEPSETVPAGYVIAELQRGYKMGDRVLRASVVRVSSGPPPEPEPTGPEGEDEAETGAPAEDAALDDEQT
ncbi:nucleotide exchange factor GrpE [Chloroflexota bacterium]